MRHMYVRALVQYPDKKTFYACLSYQGELQLNNPSAPSKEEIKQWFLERLSNYLPDGYTLPRIEFDFGTLIWQSFGSFP